MPATADDCAASASSCASLASLCAEAEAEAGGGLGAYSVGAVVQGESIGEVRCAAGRQGRAGQGWAEQGWAAVGAVTQGRWSGTSLAAGQQPGARREVTRRGIGKACGGQAGLRLRGAEPHAAHAVPACPFPPPPQVLSRANHHASDMLGAVCGATQAAVARGDMPAAAADRLLATYSARMHGYT